jgi:hypothetical protein
MGVSSLSGFAMSNLFSGHKTTGVGNAVPGVPSGKYDLDGHIFPDCKGISGLRRTER